MHGIRARGQDVWTISKPFPQFPRRRVVKESGVLIEIGRDQRVAQLLVMQHSTEDSSRVAVRAAAAESADSESPTSAGRPLSF